MEITSFLMTVDSVQLELLRVHVINRTGVMIIESELKEICLN